MTPAFHRLVSSSAAISCLALLSSCVGDVTVPGVPQSSWVDIPTPPLQRMAIFSSATDEAGSLYAGGNAHVFRSADRGRTWTKESAGLPPNSQVVSLLVKPGGAVYAAVRSSGVFVSRDRGKTWAQINNRLTDLHVESLAIGPNGELIAGTARGAIFRSENDGGIWTKVEETPLPGTVHSLGTDPGGMLYAACPGEGVFSSADGGRTWTSFSEGLENGDLHCLSIGGDGDLLVGGWRGRIYRYSEASHTWVRIDDGSTSRLVASIVTDPSGHIYAGTEGDGILVSRDGGDTWEKTIVGVGGEAVYSLLSSGDLLIAGTSSSGALLSVDDGRTWILPEKYRGLTLTNAPLVTFFAADSCGTYYIIGDNRSFRSRDRGQTWVRVAAASFSRMTALAVYPASSVIAAGPEGVFVSRDSGVTWARADTFPPGNDRYVRQLDVAGNGTIFGRTDAGVIRSLDGGSSWEYVLRSSNLASLSAGAESFVYAATYNEGVVGSSDNGATWRAMTEPYWIAQVCADRVGNVIALCEDAILMPEGVQSCRGLHCSTDRGESWRDTVVCDWLAARALVMAPGGELAVLLDREGTLYISKDCFAGWQTSSAPFASSYLGTPEMFLTPDGYLVISEGDRPALHRSREPLFVPSRAPRIFSRR